VASCHARGTIIFSSLFPHFLSRTGELLLSHQKLSFTKETISYKRFYQLLIILTHFESQMINELRQQLNYLRKFELDNNIR